MTKKAQYRQFCEEEKKIPIFSQPWHLDAVCHDGEWDVVLMEKGGQIVASMPYFIKQKGPYKHIAMPWLTKMLGPYIVEKFKGGKKEQSIIKHLIEQLPTVAHFNQNLHYDIKDWLPFYWKGYQQTTFYSYSISGLSDLDTVYKNFDSDYRNNKIKKAQELITVSHDGDINDFYRIMKMSFDRQDVKLTIPADFLQHYDQVLAKQQSSKLFFARDAEGRIHSAVYLIWDKQRAYYHIAGDDPDLRNSGAGILIVWEVIQYTSKVLGLDIFDFEGSMIPGVTKVRRNFGAKQEAFFNIERYDSVLFRVARLLKR